mmetsp:Transcript_21525/g.52558  ORF Transcript_21525/g.52558 Transcript_21525/m.52558 type:complete len:224 (+) Transcript_21525:223-894(+)
MTTQAAYAAVAIASSNDLLRASAASRPPTYASPAPFSSTSGCSSSSATGSYSVHLPSRYTTAGFAPCVNTTVRARFSLCFVVLASFSAVAARSSTGSHSMALASVRASSSLQITMSAYGSRLLTASRNGGTCMRNGALRFIANTLLCSSACLPSASAAGGDTVRKNDDEYRMRAAPSMRCAASAATCAASNLFAALKFATSDRLPLVMRHAHVPVGVSASVHR